MGFLRGCLFTVIITSCTILSSCVVTDDIEFSDAVNHPALLLNTSPSNSAVNYCASDEALEFTVTIWDPDSDDIDTYDGRISVLESVNSSVTIRNTVSCNQPVTDNNEDYQTGVVITFKCLVTMRATNAATDLLLVEIELSDKGYLPGNELQQGANALRACWTYELLPQGAI